MLQSVTLTTAVNVMYYVSLCQGTLNVSSVCLSPVYLFIKDDNIFDQEKMPISPENLAEFNHMYCQIVLLPHGSYSPPPSTPLSLSLLVYFSLCIWFDPIYHD